MSKQFIDEVNQEIKDEKLAIFWHKFKYLIIGTTVGIVVATGGYSWYKVSAAKKLESQNVALDKALGDVSALDALIQDSADGVRFVAVINKAKLLADDKKYDEAISALNAYASTTDVVIQKQYAQLSAIWVGLDAGKISAVPIELETLTQSVVFGVVAQLTKADILLQTGDIAQAREILQVIVDGVDTAQEYKSLATVILQGL